MLKEWVILGTEFIFSISLCSKTGTFYGINFIIVFSINSSSLLFKINIAKILVDIGKNSVIINHYYKELIIKQQLMILIILTS